MTNIAYRTKMGIMYRGYAEKILTSQELKKYEGKIQLIFTSPPFPLNRKKKYGNLQGDAYIKWLTNFSVLFTKFLKPNGSIIIEIGNAWEPGSPTMSILGLKSLLSFLERGSLFLCQEFICYNPARLPSPAQWVNVERIRVKDAYTHVWWMAPSRRPKSDNRKVLKTYSPSMMSLLKSQKYNAGKRPSEHSINPTSFLTNNQGAIPSNVLTISNTIANDPYQKYCRENGLITHPARMPSKLAEFFIQFLTDPSDIVLDPFAGSNTTGAVAEALGRRWLAIEPEENYIASSYGRFLTRSITNSYEPDRFS